MQRRAVVAPEVRIAADVHVKHAQPISQPDIGLAAEETAHRGGADCLIVSGSGTGKATDLSAVRLVKQFPPLPPEYTNDSLTVHLTFEYQR